MHFSISTYNNLSKQSRSRAQVRYRWMVKALGRGPPATETDNIWFPNEIHDLHTRIIKLIQCDRFSTLFHCRGLNIFIHVFTAL